MTERRWNRRDALKGRRPAGIRGPDQGVRGGIPRASCAAKPTREPDCILTPEQTTGPFYIDAGLVRQDITEDRSGAPLQLDIGIAGADTCQPIANAAVDIWHGDALGRYSGFPLQGASFENTSGQTFLRGVQVTDAAGRGDLPDHLPGILSRSNTPHPRQIILDARTLVDAQLYFVDATTDAVYARWAPTMSAPARGTRNPDDFGAGDGNGGYLDIETLPGDQGYVGRINIGIGSA